MASQEEFFASLAPSSIVPTPMPEVTVATIDDPPREHFIRVLEAVGGRLGDGTDLGDVERKAGELIGLQRIDALLCAGIQAVRTVDGHTVSEGLVESDKLRPARRGGLPIAVVEWQGDRWLPLKLD